MGGEQGKVQHLALQAEWMDAVCFREWSDFRAGDKQSEATCSGSQGVSAAKPGLELLQKITKQSFIHSLFFS